MTVRREQSTTRLHLLLFSVFAVELLAICVAHFPGSLTLDRFAFCDEGANLTAQYLTTHGLRPAVDFGFHYGLSSLLIAHCWFALFGASPLSYQAVVFAANLVIAWAIADVAAHLELGSIGLFLLFVSIGFAAQPSYPAAAHAFDAALLMLALAQQARGRYDHALAFCTADVLVKPSMGYIYGLILVVLVARRALRKEHHRIQTALFDLLPAAATGFLLVSLVAATYGPQSLLETILPMTGAINYSKLHHGFLHGTGRAFWSNPKMPWLFYLFDVSGFWICATIFLFVVTVSLLPSLWKKEWSSRTEIIVTCALLHGMFLSVLFGNQFSWFYYSYVLIVGVAFALDQMSSSRLLGVVLCVIALFAWTDRVLILRHVWRAWPWPDAATAGLWSSPDERAEWEHVREIVRGSEGVIFDTKGAAELLFPGFAPPTTLFLDEGLILSGDIERKTRQLATAQTVVVPYGIDLQVCRGIPDSPPIRAALAKFVPVYKGRYFEILRRPRTSAQAATALIRRPK